MQFLKSAFAVLLAAPIFGLGVPELSKGLMVHEWGTFTTVAGEHGESLEWSPLGTTSDLPCFVMHLHGRMYKFISSSAPEPITASVGRRTHPVTVRMETPVLYFYSPQKTKVSVAVDFPHGLITEWYPRASRVIPEAEQDLMPAVQNGHIEWNPLEINPGTTPWLAKGSGPSPYYAARNTDSDPVKIGSDEEKLLFYRGIANFPVPLSAQVSATGSVKLTADEKLELAVLFDNRGGRIGFRIVRGLQGSKEIASPELTGKLDGLKQELANALVQEGLYRKEADAMVATWSESWFEEGMRAFYLVPRQLVDRELPLTIAPAPKAIQRVFVGRVEMMSPFLRDRLTTALSTGDTATLDGFGRFLVPFMRQLNVTADTSVAKYLVAKGSQADREFLTPSCVQ